MIIKRCAIYIRVSTEEQHLNGLSLPAQKKALTEYAMQNNYTIVGCYADEGISARKPMKCRKGLLTLLADVKEDRIDMILVTKLDRWFRNISDYNITEEILRAHSCCWKTIYENYDSSTANGQMVINIMLSVNQAECDRTSERIKAVLDYKRSIGEVTSGRCACYGYKVKNNRLVKDETVSHIVEDAFSHYFTCFSVRNTIRYLEEKYGAEAPSPGKIQHLFRNETYAGRDKDDLDYCEPYITPEQFDRIRQIAGSKIYSGSSQPYLFSSLIKCPWCGSTYSGYRKKYLSKDGKERFYIRYRCGNKYNHHSCAHLTEHKIEEFLLSKIFEDISPEQVQVQMKPLKTSATNIPGQKEGKAEALRREKERLNLLFQKGRISERYYQEQYSILDQKLQTDCPKSRLSSGMSTSSIPELIPDNPSASLYPDTCSQTFSGSWLALYQELDRAHRQTFWKNILKDIRLDSESHKVSGFHFL